MLENKLFLFDMIVEVIENFFAFLVGNAFNPAGHQPVDEQRLAPGFGMSNAYWMKPVRRLANILVTNINTRATLIFVNVECLFAG